MVTIKRVIQNIFSILLVIILIVKAFYLFDLVPKSLAFVGCLGIIVLLMGMIVGKKYVFNLTENTFRVFDCKMNAHAYMYIIVFFGALLSKIIPIFLLDIISIYDGSDIQVYTETAYEIATVGKAISHAGYCWSFSHIYWFSVFLSPIAKWFGISQTAFSVYLAFCASIGTLLIFDIMVRVTSPSKALVTTAIYTLLPSQLLVSQFVTHEHAMLFFASIAVWLYSKLITQKMHLAVYALAWIGFLFALLCTLLVNSAGIVLSIAVCMMFMLFPESGKQSNRFMPVLRCIIVLVFLVVGNSMCYNIQMRHSDIRSEYVKSDKYLWTLFVGANAETKASWSEEDGSIFAAYEEGATKDEIDAYQKELIINRYRELLSTPDKLIKLIKDKLITIWALLVYPTGFANETISSTTIAGFYNRFLFKPLVLIEYAVMLMLTLLHILNMLYKKVVVNRTMFLFELYLLGMTALLMITECRNKYTISMQLFYIALCVNSIKHIEALETEV